jgi:hypothetical protein
MARRILTGFLADGARVEISLSPFEHDDQKAVFNGAHCYQPVKKSLVP